MAAAAILRPSATSRRNASVVAVAAITSRPAFFAAAAIVDGLSVLMPAAWAARVGNGVDDELRVVGVRRQPEDLEERGGLFVVKCECAVPMTAVGHSADKGADDLAEAGQWFY